MKCNDCFLFQTLRCAFVESDPNEIESLDGMECNNCEDFIAIKDKKREEKAKNKNR